MTEITAVVPAEPTQSKGLLARAVGVILSPKATYADVAAQPRILGALALVLTIVIAVSTTFSSTQRGKELALAQTVGYMESFGMQVTDDMYNRIETGIMNQRPYTSAIGTAIALPLVSAILAGLIMAVYTALLGGEAKFKQVYAVVIYSGILLALQTLFVYPMFYLKQSMSSPTSLAVFLPFLTETSFIGRLVGFVDLFRLWWVVNLAIGVAVLYKKRTSPVLSTMLAVYAAIGLIIAAIGTALGA